MDLNEKIGNILKQHKEGGKFFDALDYMIRGDLLILDNFIQYFMGELENNEKMQPIGSLGIIMSGEFGAAMITHYGKYLHRRFGEVVVTNGGIRSGNEAIIFKNELAYSEWVFIDDSYYLGRTQAGISEALRKIKPSAALTKTFVIYDGSMGRANTVNSMYKYQK